MGVNPHAPDNDSNSKQQDREEEMEVMVRNKDVESFESRPLCNAPTKGGGPCQSRAMRNSTRCRSHGGNTPAAIDAARVRALRQADPLMAKLHAIAFDDTKPPQVQLEAIKHALKVTGAFEAKQSVELDISTDRKKTFEELSAQALVEVAETDDGEWFVLSADGTAKVIPADRYNGSDVIMDLDMREDIVDAEVVTDDYSEHDYEPPATTRHDRAAFAEVERGRADEHKRMQRGGMSDAERKRREADALAEVARSTRSTADPTIARAAYIAALENGGTREEAEAAGRAAAEGVPDTGKRRARVTDATITDAAGERRRR